MKKVRHCEYSFHSTNREKKKKTSNENKIIGPSHRNNIKSPVFVPSYGFRCFIRGIWAYSWYDMRLVLYFIRLRFSTSVSGIITIKIGLILQSFLGTLHILRFTVQALHSNYLLFDPGLSNTSKLDHHRVKHLSTFNSNTKYHTHTYTHTHTSYYGK